MGNKVRVIYNIYCNKTRVILKGRFVGGGNNLP